MVEQKIPNHLKWNWIRLGYGAGEKRTWTPFDQEFLYNNPQIQIDQLFSNSSCSHGFFLSLLTWLQMILIAQVLLKPLAHISHLTWTCSENVKVFQILCWRLDADKARENMLLQIKLRQSSWKIQVTNWHLSCSICKSK